MELARRRIATDGLSKVFERIGGKHGLTAILQSHWKFVDRGKRVCVEARAVRNNIPEFLTTVLAGTVGYKGRTLEEIHQIINASDIQIDSFTVRDCGCILDIVEDVTV